MNFTNTLHLQWAQLPDLTWVGVEVAPIPDVVFTDTQDVQWVQLPNLTWIKLGSEPINATELLALKHNLVFGTLYHEERISSTELLALAHRLSLGTLGSSIEYSLPSFSLQGSLGQWDPGYWRDLYDGRIQRVTLRDSSGKILPIYSCNVFLSGTRGISITVSLPADLINEVKNGVAPWSIVDYDAGEVFRMPEIRYQHHRGGRSRSLILRSTGIHEMRGKTDRNLGAPSRAWPSGQMDVVEIPGAFDVIPGDVVTSGNRVVVAQHTQISISRENPRTWVYG